MATRDARYDLEDRTFKTTFHSLFQEADELTRIIATILRNSLS